MTDHPLAFEHAALLRHLATVQRRCDELLQRQAADMAHMRAENMKLRAAIIARDTALAWAEEDRAALAAATPGLAPRVVLARKVSELSARLQDLMRERLRPPMSQLPGRAVAPQAAGAELSTLEASIVAADLVICQTGCLSHGAFWRVQDHCKRTGKTCVMVEQPATFRVVRIHRDAVAVDQE
ncbi:DUF2325 domain-containing protein [Herbaspirillum sp. alder98]|uniref:DUF2325 domain-containing protein n=1 Tax=Herbaspirillum sp. alder98 TaxID=2913096 RepID=UPI001CD908C6|nr:DUF2325 domain-containing protein [Herbaspirillum sp. alder98]MCA1325864.1 DUF2325 domain-containing protein [Herbaspirillum sp. alder98]